MIDAAATTLKVRPDVFFVRTADGVWLRNDERSLSITGDVAYDVVRGLFADLATPKTPDALFAGVPERMRARLEDAVLAPLLGAGMLIRLRPPATTPNPELVERHADQLAFLERYVDDPVDRFARIRSRSVAVVGTRTLASAALVSAVDLGMRRIRVELAGSGAEQVQNIARAAAYRDPSFEFTLRTHAGDASLERLARDAARECDVVLLASGALRRLAPAALPAGVPLGIVAAHSGLLVVSPVFCAGDDWCLHCLQDALPVDEGTELAAPSCALGAFALLQRAFAYCAGPPVPQQSTVLTIRTDTLEVSARAVRPRSGCTSRIGEGGRASRSRLANGATPTRPDVPLVPQPPDAAAEQERISATVASLTDSLLGPILALGEDDLPQKPLAASRCVLRDAPGTSTSATCCAILAREARTQAVLFACERAARNRGLRDVGAGWSHDEAVYRALVFRTARRAAPGGETTSLTNALGARSRPLRAFLAGALSACDAGDQPIRIRRGRGALVTVELVRADASVVVAGTDEDHALDQSLLAALTAAHLPGAAPALIAPPFPTWQAAVDRAGAHGTRAVPAGDALPFVSDELHVVVLEDDR